MTLFLPILCTLICVITLHCSASLSLIGNTPFLRPTLAPLCTIFDHRYFARANFACAPPLRHVVFWEA
jgi:hypothetical protein